jgi:hypothetical protein
MTEAEWLACATATPMLEFLQGKASDRKLRLFIAACYRRIWHLEFDGLSRELVDLDEPTRQAVEAVERQAEEVVIRREPGPVIDDLQASIGQIARGMRCVEGEPYVNAVRRFAGAPTGLCGLAVFAAEEAAGTAALSTLHRPAASETAAPAAYEPPREPVPGPASDAERALEGAQEVESGVQADLLRDVFGPLPFRPVSIVRSVLAWSDRRIVRLAQAIYDERRWKEMPALALNQGDSKNPKLTSRPGSRAYVNRLGLPSDGFK